MRNTARTAVHPRPLRIASAYGPDLPCFIPDRHRLVVSPCRFRSSVVINLVCVGLEYRNRESLPISSFTRSRNTAHRSIPPVRNQSSAERFHRQPRIRDPSPSRSFGHCLPHQPDNGVAPFSRTSDPDGDTIVKARAATIPASSAASGSVRDLIVLMAEKTPAPLRRTLEW